MKVPAMRSDDALEVKMTPMIDVVFLLLVFFIWTSSFELPEFDLPSSIAEPPAAGSQAHTAPAQSVEAYDEIVIRLFTEDAIVRMELNDQRIEDVEAMKSRLSEIIQLGIQPPVIIDPADEITMNTAVEIYDAARSSGADRVLFAVRP